MQAVIGGYRHAFQRRRDPLANGLQPDVVPQILQEVHDFRFTVVIRFFLEEAIDGLLAVVAVSHQQVGVGQRVVAHGACGDHLPVAFVPHADEVPDGAEKPHDIVIRKDGDHAAASPPGRFHGFHAQGRE